MPSLAYTPQLGASGYCRRHFWPDCCGIGLVLLPRLSFVVSSVLSLPLVYGWYEDACRVQHTLSLQVRNNIYWQTLGVSRLSRALA